MPLGVAGRQSNFQACAFNHSDISPFGIDDLQPRLSSQDANCNPGVPLTVAPQRSEVSVLAAERAEHARDARIMSTGWLTVDQPLPAALAAATVRGQERDPPALRGRVALKLGDA